MEPQYFAFMGTAWFSLGYDTGVKRLGWLCLIFETPGKGSALFSDMASWHVLIHFWVWCIALYYWMRSMACCWSRWQVRAVHYERRCPDLEELRLEPVMYQEVR